jgi:hypothetical protein
MINCVVIAEASMIGDRARGAMPEGCLEEEAAVGICGLIGRWKFVARDRAGGIAGATGNVDGRVGDYRPERARRLSNCPAAPRQRD